jgi:hypothetical protein
MSFFNSFNPIDKRRTLLDTQYVSTTGAIIPQRNITPITPFGVLVKKYQEPVNSPGTGKQYPYPSLC